MIFLLCLFGMFPLLSAVLPVPAIVPILLFIGLVIGAQAFRAVPKAHYAAIVLAVVPNVASWASGLLDNTIATAQSSFAALKLPADKILDISDAGLAGNGVLQHGLTKLGEGAVLAGMILGAIAVFMIDRRFLWAAIYSFLGAVLSAVGLIHGAKVSLALAPPDRVEEHVDDLLRALTRLTSSAQSSRACSGGATVALAAVISAVAERHGSTEPPILQPTYEEQR